MAAISAAELDATWRQLERVPRPDLARALARAQELGAAAFKRKDYQGAYDHYNQAVTGLEYLARTRTFRATSFQCFVASLVSFTISFPLSLFYKTKGSARWLILGAGTSVRNLGDAWDRAGTFFHPHARQRHREHAEGVPLRRVRRHRRHSVPLRATP